MTAYDWQSASKVLLQDVGSVLVTARIELFLDCGCFLYVLPHYSSLLPHGSPSSSFSHFYVYLLILFTLFQVGSLNVTQLAVSLWSPVLAFWLLELQVCTAAHTSSAISTFPSLSIEKHQLRLIIGGHGTRMVWKQERNSVQKKDSRHVKSHLCQVCILFLLFIQI